MSKPVYDRAGRLKKFKDICAKEFKVKSFDELPSHLQEVVTQLSETYCDREEQFLNCMFDLVECGAVTGDIDALRKTGVIL